jgi:hypothetical protein
MVFHEKINKLAFRKEEKKIQKTTYFVQSAYIVIISLLFVTYEETPHVHLS